MLLIIFGTGIITIISKTTMSITLYHYYVSGWYMYMINSSHISNFLFDDIMFVNMF